MAQFSSQPTHTPHSDSQSDSLAQWLADLKQDRQDRQSASMNRSLTPLTPNGFWINPPDEKSVNTKRLINLASNDYLGLAQSDHLTQALQQAVIDHQAGSGASRLVTGTHPAHTLAEQTFTAWKHPNQHGDQTSDESTPYQSLLFPSGYTANLAVLQTLCGPDDLLLIDKLTHASLIDAARIAQALNGTTVKRYRHLDLGHADQLLARHGRSHAKRWIVTDAVFSMDGDVADLPNLCALADHHDALIINDEAHGTGVLGPTGAGLAEQQNCLTHRRMAITVSTCSKALGLAGGVVTAPEPVIDTLVNQARSLIYTTACLPAQAQAMSYAANWIQANPQPRQHVLNLAQTLREQLTQHGWSLPQTLATTPIIPLIVGDNAKALALAGHLQEHGFYAVAIRPPTVSPGLARVRLTLRADLSHKHLQQLLDAIHLFKNH